MTSAGVQAGQGGAVERKLRRAWRRERRFHHVRGLCHLLLWAGGLALADLVVDWLFLLPPHGRVALVAINLGTLGYVAYRSWLRHLRRYDPVRVALQVERRHADLKSLLVSYVQFDESAAEASHVSVALVRAARRLAAEATAPIDFREIVHWKDLARVAAGSAAVVLVCGGLSLNWPDVFATLVYRLAHPTARVAYPTRTTIERLTGSVTVPQGSEVAIEARSGGVEPPAGTLWVRPEGGQWERLVLPRTGRAAFAYRFEQVARDLEYRVRLGDATSETHTVRVVPPPYLLETRVRLSYPDYTGLADAEADSLHLEVPEGTRAAATLMCDRALARAELLSEGGGAEALALDPSGRTASFEWTVAASRALRFRWTEREHGFTYEGDVTYFVRMIPDTGPDVEILHPAEDEKATVAKRLALEYRATDDYGVAGAAVVYAVNGGPEQRLPEVALGRTPVEDRIAWTLRESVPDLKEGDAVTLAIEVADNRTGDAGPHRARSRTVRIDIVSVAEYLRYVAEKRAALFKEIQAMHEDESEASTEVKALKQEAATVPAVP